MNEQAAASLRTASMRCVGGGCEEEGPSNPHDRRKAAPLALGMPRRATTHDLNRGSEIGSSVLV